MGGEREKKDLTSQRLRASFAERRGAAFAGLGGEDWQMSQARESLPSGPNGPERATSAESSCLTSLSCENKNENKTAVGEIRVPEYSSNQNIQADTQDQPIWGNCSDGNIIRI
ncbi:myoD family inhibitor domain-containing protein-like [Crotalus tigris]|uniref:myoD family inhibitor domain-containing protein-like n=1 Tax=Crotalus tigris TaxID=88082 RepID=UPI00192FA75E|nr:myoD family inhibitor domain-containing protein-like [Crotalus tigris]